MLKAITTCLLLSLTLTVWAEKIKTPQHVFSILDQNMVNHPGNYPFPTDMTFSQFADHSLLQTTEYFDPDVVQRGDTIFLMDWYIPWFMEYIHPKIKEPYILISNDSDSTHPDCGVWDYDPQFGWSPPVKAVRTILYDSKVAAWFCKNMLLSRHPKIIQIPIGQNIIYWESLFSHFRYKHAAELMQYFTYPEEKTIFLYATMQTASNSCRPLIASILSKLPYCIAKIDQNLERSQFIQELAQAKFTMAPPGYGPDTVRFWEALTVDCIPIVVHSELDDLYSDLPVLFINDWQEIGDQDFLDKKYCEIRARNTSRDKIFFDHWAKKILAVQQSIRQNENKFSELEATKFSEPDLESLTKILKTKNGCFSELFCKGAVMTLRPFEIAEACPFITSIYVQDKWGAWAHENPSTHIKLFAKSSYGSTKLIPLNFYEERVPFFKSHPEIMVFFDLTYLRHELKNDLAEAYASILPGSLICGNEASDPYVIQMITQFSAVNKITFSTENDIWFINKQEI